MFKRRGSRRSTHIVDILINSDTYMKYLTKFLTCSKPSVSDAIIII